MDDTNVGEGQPATEPATDATSTDGNPPDGTDWTTPQVVKIAGVEVEITPEEALKGYMRQAAFTQKSQALAADKAKFERALNIQAALERNPEQAIQALASHYAVNAANRAAGDDEMDEDDQDLLNKAIARATAPLMQELEALKVQSTNLAVEREIAQLQAKFGDVDVEEVLAHAVSGNFSSLKAAYADLYFEDVYSAAKDTLAKRAADSAVLDKKRTQAGVVHAGASGSGPATEVIEAPTNLWDAWKLALAGKTVPID